MEHPKGIADILPLTAAQKGMLFQVSGGSRLKGQYVAVISCALNGPVEPNRLRRAMQSVIDTRDALRAGFVWEGVKQPVQVIQDAVSLPWTELDWRDASDIKTRLSELVDSEQVREFNLTAPPLMAATLIRTAENSWRLVWTIHHLVSDGWSTKPMFSEVFDHYQNETRTAEKPPSFKSYLVWLRKQKHLTNQDFWTEYLAELDEPGLLPAGRDTDGLEEQHSYSQTLGTDLLEQVEDLAKGLKVTTNTVLSSAWALTLRRILQRDDVVFGTTMAGRPPEIPSIANAVGSFVNTLPTRVKIDPSLSIEAFLQNHARDQIEHRKNEFASLAEVQACAPLPAGTPLFDCLFVNEGVSIESMEFGEIHLTGLTTVQYSNYPLALLVTPHGQFNAQVYYDPARMSQKTVEDYVASYRGILASMVENPEGTIRSIRRPARPQIDPQTAYSQKDVVQRFLHQAHKTPDAHAVSDGNRSLSYAELSDIARTIAGALKAQGVSKNDIIPVATARGADAIAAFLGVMMSGAAYVPLDLNYPSKRIAQVFDAAQPKFVVTTAEFSDRLPKSSGHLILLEADNPSITTKEVEVGEIAYVMFTSGSQNIPKGVEITHEGLAHSTAARDDVHGNPPKAYLLLSSLAFDSSVAGIYWTLTTGGHLVIAPTRIEQEPAKLGALITRHEITHTLCLPSLAQGLLTVVPGRDLLSLNMLIAAGEPLTPDLIELCSAQLPQCRLVNEYGPTESTVWCTSFDTAEYKGSGKVPIGRTIPGCWVGVVDIDDCELEPGAAGEIVIAGTTVARGYLNDAKQTNERFFRLGSEGPRAYRTGDLGISDASGNLTFLGRKDKQVKIRGHRIELTEIEAVARTVTGRTRVAALVQDQPGGPAIILALECDPENLSIAKVKDHLASSLPVPFQPKVIQAVETFPRLPNGKIDTNRLLVQLGGNRSSDTLNQPIGDLEKQISELFSDVIGTPCDDRDANFFDMGGDSLMTLAIYAKAKESGIEFQPTDLFTFPTVRQLAARVQELKKDTLEEPKIKTVQLSNQGGAETPVVLIHCPMAFYREVVQGLSSDHTVALVPSHRLPGRKVPFDQSMEELAKEAITSFIDKLPNRPIVFCGFSAGSALTMEIIRQLGPARVAGFIALDPPYKMLGSNPDLQPLFFKTYKRWRYQFRTLKHRRRAKHQLPHFKDALADPKHSREDQIDAVSLVYDLAINEFRVPRIDVTTHVFLTPGNPSLTPGDVLDTHLRNKQLFHLSMPHSEVIRESKSRQKILASIVSLTQARTK